MCFTDDLLRSAKGHASLMSSNHLTRRATLSGLAGGFMVWAASMPSLAGTGSAAEQAAHTAANRFLDLVREGGTRADFAALLGRHASINAIAMFALGKYRRALPPGKRDTYVSLVNEMLVNSVTRHGHQVKGEAYVVTGSQGNTVKGYIRHASGKITDVDLRMVDGRIADVRVEGIWLAFILRQEFNRIIDSKGGDISAIFAYLEREARQ